MTTPRDEIRGSRFGQLACPSCGRMAGDIVGTGHHLVMADAPGGGFLMECRDGIPRLGADLSYDEVVAGTNIALADAVTFGFDKAMGFLGPPRTRPFGGFLGSIRP